MSVFPKTRAAAGYIAGTGPGELARARATDLVLAVRDLAGTAWLDASGDDPVVAAFTVLEAAASPPDPARIDELFSRMLWARFAPGTGRDDPGHSGTSPGQPAPSPPAGGRPATQARQRNDPAR